MFFVRFFCFRLRDSFIRSRAEAIVQSAGAAENCLCGEYHLQSESMPDRAHSARFKGNSHTKKATAEGVRKNGKILYENILNCLQTKYWILHFDNDIYFLSADCHSRRTRRYLAVGVANGSATPNGGETVSFPIYSLSLSAMGWRCSASCFAKSGLRTSARVYVCTISPLSLCVHVNVFAFDCPNLRICFAFSSYSSTSFPNIIQIRANFPYFVCAMKCGIVKGFLLPPRFRFLGIFVSRSSWRCDWETFRQRFLFVLPLLGIRKWSLPVFVIAGCRSGGRPWWSMGGSGAPPVPFHAKLRVSEAAKN